MALGFLMALGTACFAQGTAFAQTCDDDEPAQSSSSDDSSYDDSSYDDYDDSPSSSTPNPCAGDSRIVGDSRCYRYGNWDVSRRRAWTLGLDIGTLRLGLDDIAISGTSMHDNLPHRWNADQLSSDTGVRVAARARFFLHPNFFLGVEASFGGVSLTGRTEGVDTRIELDSALAAGGALIAGTGVGLGNLRFDLEVAGGRRRVVVSGSSHLPDCITEFSESFGQWTLRGGAGVSYFLRPNISVGVHARYGFLQREVNGALSITVHSRAYDAR